MDTFHKQSEDSLVTSGAMPPDHFENAIERIEEVANYDLVIYKDILDRLKTETSELLVPLETLKSIVSSLVVGHVILQGPPGTGKSSLARAISKAFNALLMPVTAHEDWSTFEVIGRQSIEIENGQEKIVPINGVFTEAVIRCAGSISQHFDDENKPQATWLLIDELNRAHVDRAFGELFSVLGASEPISILLNFQNLGNRLLTTPKRFRIIGTINSFDRQFVNGLSQAIRRRFTFITIDIPQKKLFNEEWSNSSETSSLAIKEFKLVKQLAVNRINKRDQYPIEKVNEVFKSLNDDAKNLLEELFTLIEQLRYSPEANNGIYLPIGTAQLIDVVEIFMTKILVENLSINLWQDAIDWAVSVKIAPLFEVDSINPNTLKEFAQNVPQIFGKYFKRSLLETAASGLYYVEQ